MEDENVQISTNNMSVDDLKATLDATRRDFNTHITKVTGVLCALFSFLAPPNITEIEEKFANEIKEDEIFTKCINHAKNSAKLQEISYREALQKHNDENKRKGPISSEMPQRKAQPATATVSSSIPQPPVTKAQNGRDSGNRGKKGIEQ